MRLVRLGDTGITRVDFLDLVGLPASDVSGPGPHHLALAPPRPNPARRSVEIGFSLASGAHAALTVQDVSGRLVRRLAAEPTLAGDHRLTWRLDDERGQRVPAGLYFIRLETPGGALVRRVAVVQ